MHQSVVHSITLTMRESIYGFQNNTQNPFIKITVTGSQIHQQGSKHHRVRLGKLEGHVEE